MSLKFADQLRFIFLDILQLLTKKLDPFPRSG